MKTIVNALPVGTVLDSGKRKYRIVKVLGQGGFGITYQAVTTLQVGNVPVKVSFAIKEHFISSMNERQDVLVTTPAQSNAQEVKDSLSSFLVEAERLNRLSISHKGLVRVNESFRANDTAYYVMEYISGQNLRQLVEASAERRLSEADALRLIGQVTDAVGYLHQNQVTHLDIKPDNILLREDGTPVLIDFGLSKHYDRQGHATSSLKVAGCSDGYAPLEQYAGIDRFTPEADVYALAATLLFLLTGKDPRKASDITEQQIRQSLPADVSETTRSAIVHGMQKIREHRTQSVNMLCVDMNVGRSGDSSEPDTHVYESMPRKKASLHILWVCLIVFAGVALITVLLMTLLLGRGSRRAATEEDDEEAVRSFEVKGVTFNMIRVDGGTFMMGATTEQEDDADDDEMPAHEVTLSDYYIGETEVTQALWEAVMGSNPSDYQSSNRPVENISWDDCQTFIKRLNKKTGEKFRLPTEAEWEYAARGGKMSKGYVFSGSNDLNEVAWYDNISDDKTHVVKTRKPNELGLYDMSGNVWEWCQDGYGDYSSVPQKNPKGAPVDTVRVSRGGGWDDANWDCRVSTRDYNSPSDVDDNIGLRLAF